MTYSGFDFSASEVTRYSRHILLPELGRLGQAKLKAAHVLIVGAGGLGAPCGIYLAAAGVGKITIMDDDCVDLTNLQRQVWFQAEDLGKPKCFAAARHLRSLNPCISIAAVHSRLHSAYHMGLIRAADLIIDASDNFATKYLLNSLCFELGKPLLMGSVERFRGSASLFVPGQGACYRCVFPTPPPAGVALSCSAAGVLGVVPGMIGLVQATEAVKFLAFEDGSSLQGQLLIYDALEMQTQKYELSPSLSCPVCVGQEVDAQAVSSEPFQAQPEIDITWSEVALAEEQYDLVDIRSAQERQIVHIPGSSWLPIAELDVRLPQSSSPARQIVLYCKSGQRSHRVARDLNAKGYQLRSLAGGVLAWQECHIDQPYY